MHGEAWQKAFLWVVKSVEILGRALVTLTKPDRGGFLSL